EPLGIDGFSFIASLDNQFSQLTNLRSHVFNMFFEPLKIYRLITFPILDELLAQDYYEKNENIIFSGENLRIFLADIKERNTNSIRTLILAGISELGNSYLMLKELKDPSTLLLFNFYKELLNESSKSLLINEICPLFAPGFVIQNLNSAFLELSLDDQSLDPAIETKKFFCNTLPGLWMAILEFWWNFVDILIPNLLRSLIISTTDFNNIVSELSKIILIHPSKNESNSADYKIKYHEANQLFNNLRQSWEATQSDFTFALESVDRLFRTFEGQIYIIFPSESEEVNILKQDLFHKKLNVLHSLLNACNDRITLQIPLINVDPTHEWIFGNDSYSMIMNHTSFAKFKDEMKIFLETCIRDMLFQPSMKMMARFAKKLAQRITESQPKSKTKPKKTSISGKWTEKTSLPFVDSSKKCIATQLENGQIDEETIN
ncbi:hypothetical protein HK096_009179, partial [Nowakowskiella sp. JEL0078]